LHNDFDFAGLEYSAKAAVFRLRWTKSLGDWVAADAPETIELVCVSPSCLIIRHGDGAFASPSTLEFAGYLHAEDQDVMDGYLERDEVAGPYHLIFVFQGGLAIKLAAESISVTAGQVPT